MEAHIGRWKLSSWYSTDLDVNDRPRFDDIGINVQRVRGNFTAHLGPNKLSRRVGYQAGVEVAGGPTHEYMLLRIWVIYWTLTIGLTWRDRREG